MGGGAGRLFLLVEKNLECLCIAWDNPKVHARSMRVVHSGILARKCVRMHGCQYQGVSVEAG